MTLIKKLWDWLNEEIERVEIEKSIPINPFIQWDKGRFSALKLVKQKLLQFAREDLKEEERLIWLLPLKNA